MCVHACVCVIRGSRVHDAGGGGADAGAAVVVVHPEVVTQLMSNDGRECREVVVGELDRWTYGHEQRSSDRPGTGRGTGRGTGSSAPR